MLIIYDTLTQKTMKGLVLLVKLESLSFLILHHPYLPLFPTQAVNVDKGVKRKEMVLIMYVSLWIKRLNITELQRHSNIIRLLYWVFYDNVNFQWTIVSFKEINISDQCGLEVFWRKTNDFLVANRESNSRKTIVLFWVTGLRLWDNDGTCANK